MSRIAVIGAGAFGTALAIVLAEAGRDVVLVTRSEAQAAALRSAGENASRLPGVRLPQTLSIVPDPAPGDAGTVLLAVPTQSLAAYLAGPGAVLNGRRIVLCCKGIDLQSGLRPSEVARRACPESRVAVLTGPSFAEDIACGLPTALTLASGEDGGDLQELLSTASLRLYLTHDVVGAELGGALKNVIALAAGLTIGAGLGESARAAVVTRGFAEMSRFAVSEGARPETLTGLSGLGDLLLTCTSPKSRNFSAGRALGAGEAALEGRTIEGLATAEAVSNLARNRGLDMPLSTMVAAVTHGRLSVREAGELLMSRPLRKE